MGIPPLTRKLVEQAIAEIEKGRAHPFGESTGYELVFNGRAYPPKAVVGSLALGHRGRHRQTGARAQKVRGSAIDARTTRHAGYAISQRKRKLVEQVFGWMKTTGLLRQVRHRGGGLVEWIFCFTAAAYNLTRMRRLLEA